MKPFLGIDLTLDKKNEQTNGTEFLVATPSSAMAQSFDNSMNKAEETVESAKLPLVLRIIQTVCGCVGAIFAIGILRALGEVSIVEAYRNAPWVDWTAGICLAVWGILKIISKVKEKSVMGTEESSRAISNLEMVSKAVYTELAVPDSAKAVDILFFYYKNKDGQIKVQEKGMQITQYFNPEFKIFKDEENLYLANLEGKYAFPLSALTKLHTVKKHIRMLGWNKDEQLNKGIYKQYKLTTDNYGCVHSKYYHILEVAHDGESFGIYFPCYELPIFSELTGLTVQE